MVMVFAVVVLDIQTLLATLILVLMLEWCPTVILVGVVIIIMYEASLLDCYIIMIAMCSCSSTCLKPLQVYI